MNELALFAGAGGGILGGHLLGWRTVCAVEWEPYPASVLIQRQNEGFLPPFPVWDDIQTFDGRPWRGVVDVVSGGFPCQDISSANSNGKGLDGSKSRLWFEMLRVICEVRPEWVLVENSANLRTRGLGVLLKGLAESGYDAAWGVLSAEAVGANHKRERMWVVGHTDDRSQPVKQGNDEAPRMSKSTGLPADIANTHRAQCEGGGLSRRGDSKHTHPRVGGWWEDTSHLDGMDDGVAYRMDRLKAIGNGQVPVVAATAFRELSDRILLAKGLKTI